MHFVYLFHGGNLCDHLQARASSALDAIAKLPPEKIDGVSADEWASRMRVEPLAIDESNISRSQIVETQVDARRPEDVGRPAMDGYGQSVMIPGRRIDCHLPYSGDRQLLSCTPDLMGPVRPVGCVGDEKITVRIEGAANRLDAETIKSRLNAELRRFGPWMDAANKQVESHNAAALSQVSAALDRRRKATGELADLEGDLDIPVSEGPSGSPQRPSSER